MSILFCNNVLVVCCFLLLGINQIYPMAVVCFTPMLSPVAWESERAVN